MSIKQKLEYTPQAASLWKMLIPFLLIILGMVFAQPVPTTYGISADNQTELQLFTDVPSGHVYDDGIYYARAQGIVEGYMDGSFRPEASINRAEFIKMMVEATASDEELANCTAYPFPDVPRGSWYARYVCQGKQLGLIDGYPDGSFRGATTINVAEAAKILANAFNVHQQQSYDLWYEGHIRALAEVQAIPALITSFDHHVTRGEFAEMVYRLRANVTTKPSATFESIAGLAGTPMYVNFPVMKANAVASADFAAQCDAVGGTYDSCASACAPGVEACIQVCRELCTIPIINNQSTMLRKAHLSKLVYQAAAEAAQYNCSILGGTYQTCDDSCALGAQVCTKECAMTCSFGQPQGSTYQMESEQDVEVSFGKGSTTITSEQQLRITSPLHLTGTLDGAWFQEVGGHGTVYVALVDEQGKVFARTDQTITLAQGTTATYAYDMRLSFTTSAEEGYIVFSPVPLGTTVDLNAQSTGQVQQSVRF